MDGGTVERNRALQMEWYGEPLGDRFRRVLERLGLSQAGLAEVLGLSAPMLSQLMNGHRAKISNPAVLGRLLEAERLAADETFMRLPPAERRRTLDRIKAAPPATSAPAIQLPPSSPAAVPSGATAADPVTAIQALLRAVASAEEIESAAQRLDRSHPELAALLRVYGNGRTADARAHYTRVLGGA